MGMNMQVLASIVGQYTGAPDIGTLTQEIAKRAVTQFLTGTGAGQADILFADTRTLAASGTENLDLAGALVDAFGATVSFAKIKAIMIVAAAANTNDVVVGGLASLGWLGPFGAAAHTVAVKPGGVLLMSAPGVAGLGAVTAATADLLKILNSGGTTGVTYDVIILGTSA